MKQHWESGKGKCIAKDTEEGIQGKQQCTAGSCSTACGHLHRRSPMRSTQTSSSAVRLSPAACCCPPLGGRLQTPATAAALWPELKAARSKYTHDEGFNWLAAHGAVGHLALLQHCRAVLAQAPGGRGGGRAGLTRSDVGSRSGLSERRAADCLLISWHCGFKEACTCSAGSSAPLHAPPATLAGTSPPPAPLDPLIPPRRRPLGSLTCAPSRRAAPPQWRGCPGR